NAEGTIVGTTGTFQTSASSCVAEKTVIAEDKAALTEAKDALAVDEADGSSSVTSAKQALSADEATAASDEAVLATARSSAVNANSTFTSLPSAGQVI